MVTGSVRQARHSPAGEAGRCFSLQAILTSIGRSRFILICSFAVGRGLSQQPGTERWEVNLGGHLYASPAVANDGTIYVGVSENAFSYFGASNGWVYAISPQGTTNWAVNTSADVRSSPVIGADGTIYAATVNGYVYAISPMGITNWIFNTKMSSASAPYIVASPALGSDGTIYVEAKSTYDTRFGYPERLYALHPSGTTNWVFTPGFNAVPVATDYFPASSPAIGPDGTIYIGSSDHHLYAINPSGRTNWVFVTGGEIYSSPAVGPDGTVYIGCDDHKVYAVDQRGLKKWEFLTGDVVEASPTVAADSVYFASEDGKTYALDFNGTQKWAAATHEGASSAAGCADGSLYVNTEWLPTTQLQALNSAGSNMWSFDLHTMDYVVSSPAIAPDGTIYTCAGATLYAIYGTKALLDSSWPMFRRDLKHTARSIRRQIQAPRILSDGSFAMTLIIETGRTYRIQASSDLAGWAELTNFASTSLTNQYVDFNATNFVRRYYRLATP